MGGAEGPRLPLSQFLHVPLVFVHQTVSLLRHPAPQLLLVPCTVCVRRRRQLLHVVNAHAGLCLRWLTTGEQINVKSFSYLMDI